MTIILFEMVKDIIKKRKSKESEIKKEPEQPHQEQPEKPKDVPKEDSTDKNKEVIPMKPKKEEKKKEAKKIESETKTYPLECITCLKKSKTTDKETSEMNQWICRDCTYRIKSNKSEVQRVLGLPTT